ncbi:integration host factor subunit beta [bacterium]|nr:integration host factor subunit beta [bacterium]
MNKSELIDIISDEANIKRKDAIMAVDAIIKKIMLSLKKGERVELRGFGSFQVKVVKERVGRNPQTGENVNVPPKKVVGFKIGKDFKSLLNEDDLK